MKKTLLLLLIIFKITITYSQNVDVKWGESIEDKEFGIYKLLGEIDGKYYALMSNNKSIVEFKINTYDKNFNLIESKKSFEVLEKIPKKSTFSLEYVTLMNNNLNLFYSILDKKSKIKTLHCNIYSLEGKLVKSYKPDKFNHVKDKIKFSVSQLVLSYDKINNNTFIFRNSEDNSKILVANIENTDKNEYIKTFNIKVFNSDFKKPILEKKISYQLEKKQKVLIDNLSVNNSGEVIFVQRIQKVPKAKFKKITEEEINALNEENVKITVNIIKDSKSSPKEIDIKFNGKSLTEIHVLEQENSIAVFGMFIENLSYKLFKLKFQSPLRRSDLSDHEILFDPGFFSMKFNKETLRPEFKQFYSLPEYKRTFDYDQYVSYYQINNVKQHQDGSYSFLAEQSTNFTETIKTSINGVDLDDANSEVSRSNIKHFINDYIIAINVDKNGKLTSHYNIKKYQHTTNDGGYSNSYSSFINNNEFYTFFNDYISNEKYYKLINKIEDSPIEEVKDETTNMEKAKKKKKKKKIKFYNYYGPTKESTMVLAKYDVQNGLSYKYFEKSINETYIPKKSKVISDNRLLIIATSKSNHRLGIIILNDN